MLSRFCYFVLQLLYEKRGECFTLIVYLIPRDSILWLFHAVQPVDLQCVIVAFPDYTLVSLVSMSIS